MLKKEFAGVLKLKTITDSEELKRKLNERSISELRTLKANTKTLSEWNKVLTMFLAVICIKMETQLNLLQ